MSNVTNSTRASFFPNSKTNFADKASNNKNVALKRNDLIRKNEIENTTQNDAKVDIPDAIKDFSRIRSAVDAAPDLDRSKKIADLKAQINNGTYKVDYEALADKILSTEF